MSWNPTEDFFARFDDKTGEERDENAIDEMVHSLTQVANEYGFGLVSAGSWSEGRIAALAETSKILMLERIAGDNG